MSNQGKTNDKLGTDTVRDTLKREPVPTEQELFKFFQTGCHMHNQTDDSEGERGLFALPKLDDEH